MRLLCRLMTAVALTVLAFEPAGAQTWYLNGAGPGVAYQLWSFDDDGYPKTATPAITLPSGVSYLAWPTPILDSGTTKVFASLYAGAWDRLGLWTTTDHINHTYQGVVFQANGSEPNGIGPTAVMYDPAETEPYALYYLVRSAGGPGPSIALATSVDGLTWTRRGNVISASLPEEAGGLSMTHACKMANGDYALFYHGYSAAPAYATGVPLVATSSSRAGPFTGKSILLSPDGFGTTLTGSAGHMTGTVPVSVNVPLGMPMVLVGANKETIVVVKQDGVRVWFDRPLTFPHSGSAMHSAARSKVDPSYAQEQPDGSWKGIFTVYGPFAGVFAEYATEVSAPAVTGPWTFSGKGLRFNPWLPGLLDSAENPAKVVSSPSCAN